MSCALSLIGTEAPGARGLIPGLLVSWVFSLVFGLAVLCFFVPSCLRLPEPSCAVPEPSRAVSEPPRAVPFPKCPRAADLLWACLLGFPSSCHWLPWLFPRRSALDFRISHSSGASLPRRLSAVVRTLVCLRVLLAAPPSVFLYEIGTLAGLL